MDQAKLKQKLEVLYDWMQIVNKEKREKNRYHKLSVTGLGNNPTPNSSANPKDDIKLIFNLIRLPFEDSEIEVLYSLINPQGKAATPLTKQEFVECLCPPEEQTKKNNKMLLDSFRFLSGNSSTISSTKLKEELQIFTQYPELTETVLRQLAEFEGANKEIDYKKYCETYF